MKSKIAPALVGFDACDQVSRRPGDDRPRRDEDQVEARRERHPRRLARDGEGRGRGARPAPLQVHRGPQREGPARADDEHHERRGPFRRADRLPGVHDHADRRRHVRRGPAHGLRGLPLAEEGPQGQGPVHRGRRRGRVRAEARVDRGRPRLDLAGRQAGGLQARQGHRVRAGSGGLRVLRGREEELRLQEVRRPGAQRRPDGGLLQGAHREVPDHLDRGRLRRERLGHLEEADGRASATRSSWSATTSSSRTPSSSRRASTPAPPTRSSSR